MYICAACEPATDPNEQNPTPLEIAYQPALRADLRCGGLAGTGGVSSELPSVPNITERPPGAWEYIPLPKITERPPNAKEYPPLPTITERPPNARVAWPEDVPAYTIPQKMANQTGDMADMEELPLSDEELTQIWGSERGQATLDGIQRALGELGMIPGVGAPFDGLNAVISLLRKHYGEAALSLAAIAPFLDTGIAAVKMVKYGGETRKVRALLESVQNGLNALKTGKRAKAAENLAGVTEEAIGHLDEAADAGKGLAKGAEEVLTEGAGDKGVNYSRPSGYRKGVRDKVWENAIEDDGEVRDPLTQEIINKDDPWQMGHKPGYEFRKHQQSAIKRGISREEFLDEHNNPYHYRPELPGSNLSHKGEDMTEQYFGP